MDIFDAVTIWLEQAKSSGVGKIYLSQASKTQLTKFLELTRDQGKLESWLAENKISAHEAPILIETTLNPVQVKESTVIEKPEPESSEIVAFEPEIVLTPPVLEEKVNALVAPPIETVEKVTVIPQFDNHSDFVFLKELSSQTKILIIGEQLYDPKISQPFERSKKLLQKMINAMDGVIRKSMLSGLDLSWETISLVEVCKKNFNGLGNPHFIRTQLSEIITATNPDVVLLMGSLPTEALINQKASVLNIHGQWFNFQNVACMPTFHPDFLNRAESRKKEAWADLQKVIKLLSDRRK